MFNDEVTGAVETAADELDRLPAIEFRVLEGDKLLGAWPDCRLDRNENGEPCFNLKVENVIDLVKKLSGRTKEWQPYDGYMSPDESEEEVRSYDWKMVRIYRNDLPTIDAMITYFKNLATFWEIEFDEDLWEIRNRFERFQPTDPLYDEDWYEPR